MPILETQAGGFVYVNPDAITVPVAGTYMVMYHLSGVSSHTCSSAISVLVNNNVHDNLVKRSTIAPGFHSFAGAALVILPANSTIRLTMESNTTMTFAINQFSADFTILRLK